MFHKPRYMSGVSFFMFYSMLHYGFLEKASPGAPFPGQAPRAGAFPGPAGAAGTPSPYCIGFLSHSLKMAQRGRFPPPPESTWPCAAFIAIRKNPRACARGFFKRGYLLLAYRDHAENQHEKGDGFAEADDGDILREAFPAFCQSVGA